MTGEWGRTRARFLPSVSGWAGWTTALSWRRLAAQPLKRETRRAAASGIQQQPEATATAAAEEPEEAARAAKQPRKNLTPFARPPLVEEDEDEGEEDGPEFSSESDAEDSDKENEGEEEGGAPSAQNNQVLLGFGLVPVAARRANPLLASDSSADEDGEVEVEASGRQRVLELEEQVEDLQCEIESLRQSLVEAEHRAAAQEQHIREEASRLTRRLCDAISPAADLGPSIPFLTTGGWRDVRDDSRDGAELPRPARAGGGGRPKGIRAGSEGREG